uniref:Dehydrogenase/reductase SDR family member 11-like n=1 Tax=Stegastes partitus TaxID=144197 RepID=A0A3B5AZL3_9TELE
MFAAIKAQHKGVDVCINNAGLAHPEPLLSGKTSGWKNMLDLNVIGLSICTREAYQSMKERNVDDGHIINLNSLVGHSVYPFADGHFYAATKYAVTALTEGLRQELHEAKSHIRATSISPGLVETEFAYRAYSKEPEKAAAAIKMLDIAEAVVYVLGAPPHVQVFDFLCVLFYYVFDLNTNSLLRI